MRSNTSTTIEEEKQVTATEALKDAATAACRKAELKASLNALSQEKEVATVKAQTEVLEAAAEQNGGESRSRIDSQELSEDPGQHTRDYVLDHSGMYASLPSLHDDEGITAETLLLPHEVYTAPPDGNQSNAHSTMDASDHHGDPYVCTHTDALYQARNPGMHEWRNTLLYDHT
ncbi:UNVERIFIED_CONTAM: hypothetical protein FKN15_037455 [Acipenser sinensis]